MGCGTSRPPQERSFRRESHSIRSISQSSQSSISSFGSHKDGKNKHNDGAKEEGEKCGKDNGKQTLDERKNTDVQPQEEQNIGHQDVEKESNRNLAEDIGHQDVEKESNRNLADDDEAKQDERDVNIVEESKNTNGDNTEVAKDNEENVISDKCLSGADIDNETSEQKVEKNENGTSEKSHEESNNEVCPETNLDIVGTDTEMCEQRMEENNENQVSEDPPQEKSSNDISDEQTEKANDNENTEIMEGKADVLESIEDNFNDHDDGYDDNYTPFDEEDDDNLEIDGYEQNTLGLMVKSVDFRSEQADEEKEQRPVVEPGELHTDRDFPLEIAIVQDSPGVEWKRPGEFLSEPILFHDQATRFDIGQGSAGTCWFLSTVATIADKDDMINQVVPKDAYNIANSEAYDGVFHARFFRFGRWEDIYIDDYIPVLYGTVPWGARSSTNENEVWISLLEKAFARLHGSYDAVYGGQPGDAYLQLTGGIGERIELDGQGKSHIAFYERVTNALKTGSQITCVVPDEFDNYQGLVGGHAYSLVGYAEIDNTKLVRVRNPWGRGEWKGPWSDESEQWELIASSDEKTPQKDDGEFYICLKDFMKYFSQTTICSLTPDFDCDGKSDPMNFILNVFGEWTDSGMGGFGEVLKNPRFSFTVTEEGMLEDGTVPLVIQMIQHTQKRKAQNASIRCDVFKIKGDKLKACGRAIAAEVQGKKNNVYTTELQSSFRHRLKPGRYMAIPSTCDGGIKKAFLIRIYSPAPLKNIKQVAIDANVLSCENEESLIHGGHTFDLTFDKTLFGSFVSGVNAGGQVSNRDTYSINPQYLISIPKTGAEVPLVVHIMQTQAEPQYPIGFRIFALDKGVNPPVNVDYLYDKYNDSPADIEGNKSKFMISWDVDVRYLLPPGRYVALVHMDQPDTEKSFAIVFKSNANIGIKGLQTGE